jgi:hypothetical protein
VAPRHNTPPDPRPLLLRSRGRSTRSSSAVVACRRPREGTCCCPHGHHHRKVGCDRYRSPEPEEGVILREGGSLMA